MPNEDPTSGPLSDVFLEADPEMTAFMARHNALLERVTVLERALEKITFHHRESQAQDMATFAAELQGIAHEALNG